MHCDQSIHVIRPNQHQIDKIYPWFFFCIIFIISLVLNQSEFRCWMIWAGWLRKSLLSYTSIQMITFHKTLGSGIFNPSVSRILVESCRHPSLKAHWSHRPGLAECLTPNRSILCSCCMFITKWLKVHLLLWASFLKIGFQKRFFIKLFGTQETFYTFTPKKPTQREKK